MLPQDRSILVLPLVLGRFPLSGDIIFNYELPPFYHFDKKLEVFTKPFQPGRSLTKIYPPLSCTAAEISHLQFQPASQFPPWVLKVSLLQVQFREQPIFDGFYIQTLALLFQDFLSISSCFCQSQTLQDKSIAFYFNSSHSVLCLLGNNISEEKSHDCGSHLRSFPYFKSPVLSSFCLFWLLFSDLKKLFLHILFRTYNFFCRRLQSGTTCSTITRTRASSTSKFTGENL